MEEKKPKKLSYEELEQKASEVFMANQKMQKHIEKMQEYIKQLQDALEEKDFNYTSFFLSMLFKVVEHTEHYTPEFVKWCIENIEGTLVAFVDAHSKEAEKESTESDESR